MILLCVDIGLINMGIAVVNVTNPNKMECKLAARVDITDFRCKGTTCTLSHEAMPVDWVAHFLRDYKTEFESCDKVLLERQPPGGFRCIEQLLYQAYRQKTVFIQPRSFLAHFGIGAMEYDHRKAYLVRAAKRVYQNDVATRALSAERAHDVADALMFAVYHVEKAKMYGCCADVTVDFERYTYTKAKLRCRPFPC